jgi:transposase
MTEYFIALDVHCAFSEMAVVTGTGKFVTRDRCVTAVPALVKMISQVRRPRRLTFEEGPLADWLARELSTRVNELVVCEPRRNHWIAKDADKDDPLDARKLADLFRGGYLKPVHQAGSLERSLLKQQVLLYHDRVRERVRQGNQLVSLWRRHGVFVKALTLLDEQEWQWQLTRLPVSNSLRRGLAQVREVYGLLVAQETSLREELAGRAKNIEAVRRFAELPGIGWIRGVTFYALIDTPHRFRSKAALWRYAGIGLERRHSGAGATRTRLSRRGNRRLKDVLLGAAKSAIAQADNSFADKFLLWRDTHGLHPANAKRNVARALAATMWSLWKSGQTYEPRRVAQGGGRPAMA